MPADAHSDDRADRPADAAVARHAGDRRRRRRPLLPALKADLADLVRIPSVSVPGQLGEPLLEAFAMTSGCSRTPA